MTLEEELVVLAIASFDRQPTGPLFRRDHGKFWRKALDLDDRLAALIGTRHGELEIPGLEKLRGNILQIERRELRQLLLDLLENLGNKDVSFADAIVDGLTP